MQTFLPYPDYRESARVLDDRRLGKQRVESKQILRALRRETEGWRNHPATRMWRRHEGALVWYSIAVCVEWRARGFDDTLLNYFIYRSWEYRHPIPPPWMNDPDFHRAHRSNLLRKDPEHYGPLFEDGLPADLPYVWPVAR